MTSFNVIASTANVSSGCGRRILQPSVVTEQLQHYSHDDVVALVRDFLSELDEDEQRRFLALVARGPRPVVAESLGLGVGDLLLEEIQELHDAIANDASVIHGVGFDPEYGTHRGFGDDSWIKLCRNIDRRIETVRGERSRVERVPYQLPHQT